MESSADRGSQLAAPTPRHTGPAASPEMETPGGGPARGSIAEPRATSEGRRAAPRVAIVHDWLTGMRGGEKVLEAICALFPSAPIYTLVHVPGSVSRVIESHPIRTSIAQWLPGAKK